MTCKDSWREVKVTILHNRPGFPPNIIFVKYWPIITPETKEKLKTIFAKAFKKANPKWDIVKIRINEK